MYFKPGICCHIWDVRSLCTTSCELVFDNQIRIQKKLMYAQKFFFIHEVSPISPDMMDSQVTGLISSSVRKISIQFREVLSVSSFIPCELVFFISIQFKFTFWSGIWNSNSFCHRNKIEHHLLFLCTLITKVYRNNFQECDFANTYASNNAFKSKKLWLGSFPQFRIVYL